MPIRAEAFDGTTHEFPDGTPAPVIDKAMKAYTQSAKPKDPYANLSLEEIQKRYQQRKFVGSKPEELAGIADAYVSREQSDRAKAGGITGVLNAADNFVRGAATGALGGGALDELNAAGSAMLGGDYNEALDYQRARTRFSENKFGALETGTQIAGGVASAVAGARALGLGSAGSALPQSTRLMPTIPQALKLGATGAGVGAADMFTRGEGGVENRLLNAGVGAAFGGVLGAAAPYVGGAVSAGTQRVLDFLTSDQALKRLGISRNAANVLIRQLSTDDSATSAGAARIRAAGPEAMVVDSGDAAAELLNTALARSGPGSTAAKTAVSSRVQVADEQLGKTLDDVFGDAVGTETRKAGVRDAARADTGDAYRNAYDTIIDFASDAGKNLKSIVAAAPKEAIARAFNLMKMKRIPAKQITIGTDDLGNLVLDENPNVQTLDYIKRAIFDMEADLPPGAAGGKSSLSSTLTSLGLDLRDSLRTAAPAYGDALELATDTISKNKAADMGRKLMLPSTTVEDTVAALKRMTDPEKAAVKGGVRDFIDHQMGNIKGMIDNPDIPPEELTRTIREFASRNTRDKMKELLGEKGMRDLYAQLGRFSKAAQLKQAVAKGSQTFTRTSIDEQVKAQMEPGVIQSILDLNAPQAIKKIFQQLSGATPERRLAMEDKLYGEIANALTTVRGTKAEQMLLNLRRAIQARSTNQAGARAIGGVTTGATYGAGQSAAQQAITE